MGAISGAFGEIADLAGVGFVQEAFEDVVDLPQADARMISQFTLGGDGLATEDI